MNYLDIIIFLGIVVAFILGFKDGFVRKLIGTLGFFLAIFLAIKFYDDVGRSLHSVTNIEPYFSEILGGILIFIFVIFITAMLKRVIHPFDKVNNMMNRIVGGAAGVIQILFFISAIFLLLNVFNFPSKKDKSNSLMYNKVYRIIPNTVNLISDYTPGITEPLKKNLSK